MASTISVTLKMIDQMSQKMDSIANSGDKAANNIIQFGDRANQAFDRAISGSEKLSETMQSATTATSDYADKSAKAQEALENQANSADRAAEEVGEFGDESQEAGRQSEEFGDKASKSAMDLGDALVAAGIVVALKEIAAAYFECDDAADTFEASMAKVSTIADESAASLNTIRGDINKLSQETGQSVNDLSEAAYSAISASVDTADAVQFVAQANALAVGGFTQSATAVDVLTTTINAYEMEASAAAEISDKLVNTQNLGKTTVDELAQSMGMVIPTAAAFNVSLDNLTSAYVTLTRNGINTANATTMLNGMLSELADEGSDVADILRGETGQSFSELMESGKNLGDVMAILGDYVEGDSTAFINLWGNVRAGRGAVNIFNAGAQEFSKVMDSMAKSTGSADEAFKKMSNTGQHVEQLWTNALENFKIAVGNAAPSLDGLMEQGTKLLNFMSGFIEKNPSVVQGITAIVVALGTFTVAMTAYSATTLLAEKATIALTAAMDTNPIFLVVTALAALTAGIVVFISSMEDAEFQDKRLTATSQELSDEISRQEAIVADLEERYGATNEKTLEAKAKLEELKAEYEQTGQTIGEFKRQIEETAQAVSESTAKYEEAIEALDNQDEHAQVLIAELERLQNQSQLTAFQQEYQKQVVEELNNIYPELGMVYDETTGKLNKSTSSLKAYCEQKQQQLKIEQDAATYIEYTREMAEYTSELETAQKNLTAATEEYNEQMEKFGNMMTTVGGNDIASASIEMAKNAMDDAQGTVDNLTDKIADLQAKMDDLEGSANAAADSINGVGDSSENVIKTTEGMQTAMQNMFAQVEEQGEELAAAYREAYDAATQAVESSFGLFEDIKTETGKTTESMIKAFEDQTKYLEKYTENLNRAKEAGLDSNLIGKLSDGSKESAADLDSIIKKIDELGGKGKKVDDFVKEMNDSFKKVEESKKTLEDTMVEMNETLQTKMSELKTSMETKVDEMNFDEEMATAAQATMEAYAKAIEEYGQTAVDAAEAVAQAVSKALNSAQGSLSSKGYPSSVKGNALGTTYGENVYIAGEYGPELIVGRQGSEVFPASETAKILNAVMNYRDSEADVGLAPQEVTNTVIQNTNSTSTNTENRNITLTIKGKGSLDIGQSVSRKDLHNFIADELEGALINILSREFYEEGAVAYEY